MDDKNQNPETSAINKSPDQFFSQQQQNNSMQEQFSNQNFLENQINNNSIQQCSNENLPQEKQNIKIVQESSSPISNRQQLNLRKKKSSKLNFFQKRQNSKKLKKSSSPIFIQQNKNSNIQKKSSNRNIPNKLPNSKNLKKSSSPVFVQQQKNIKIQKNSSNPCISQNINNQSPKTDSIQNQNNLKTQTFKVIYDGSTFMVDPVSLSSFSLKFNELIKPYIEDHEEMKVRHLEIRGDQFTKRNIDNFLRLCQKLPTDVENSEMKEICEIAKMFKAEQIYQTGINFIQKYQDPNFSVPDDKYDDSYLTLAEETNFIQNNDSDLKEEFNDTKSSTFNDSKSNSNEDQDQDISNQNNEEEEDINNNISVINDQISNPKEKIVIKSDNSENVQINPENVIETIEKVDDESDQKSIIYMVRVENRTFKCPIFRFVNDEHIMYTAKQKLNDIFIGEGCVIHIRNKENHVAHIFQHEVEQFNKIHIGDTDFPLNYVNSGIPGRFSIEVTFPFKDKSYTMSPKMPKFDMETKKYYLDFNGDYQHTPIISSKNIVLQNSEDLSNFIVRKMDLNLYEIECNKKLDPLIAFIIGLSDIVGPFNNPYANVNLYD